jgi:predicted ATPase with chaperone activity
LVDVNTQPLLKRALTKADAGGQYLLVVAPCEGKTMLANILRSLIPQLTLDRTSNLRLLNLFHDNYKNKKMNTAGISQACSHN